MATTSDNPLNGTTEFGKKPAAIDAARAAALRREAEIENIRHYLSNLVRGSNLPADKQDALIASINSDLSGAMGHVNVSALVGSVNAAIKRELLKAEEEAALRQQEAIIISNELMEFHGIKLSAAAQHCIHTRTSRIDLNSASSVEAFVKTYDDPGLPPPLRKQAHNDQVFVLTHTDEGKRIVAKHNEYIAKHPAEYKAYETEKEKAKAATDTLLQKHSSGSVHHDLELIKRHHLERYQEVRQVLAKMHAGKPVASEELHKVVEQGLAENRHYQKAKWSAGAQVLKGNAELRQISDTMTAADQEKALYRLQHDKGFYDKVCNSCMNPNLRPTADKELKQGMVALRVANALDPLADMKAAFDYIEKVHATVTQKQPKNLTQDNYREYLDMRMEYGSISKSAMFRNVSKDQRIEDAYNLLKKNKQFANVEWTDDNKNTLRATATRLIEEVDKGRKLEQIDLRQSLETGLGYVVNGDKKLMTQYADMVEREMTRRGAPKAVASTIHSALVGIGNATISGSKWLEEHDMHRTSEVFKGAMNAVGKVGVEAVVMGEKADKKFGITDKARAVSKRVNDFEVNWDADDNIKDNLSKLEKAGWTKYFDTNKDGKLSVKEVTAKLKAAGIKLEDFDTMGEKGQKGRDGDLNGREITNAMNAALKAEREKEARAKAAEVKAKETLAKYDTNHNGKLDGNEAAVAMHAFLGGNKLPTQDVKSGQHAAPAKTPVAAQPKPQPHGKGHG